ncbi:hypothetical protein ElyMa_002263400 [Elysia marginata]|uniref:Uncharacterized protein n=1 Tax=Elysia marginata TaxID=1093978 RepID=A0AAV4FZU7_9GAST|nr:hypothetical protein ElyMa_002263400 [Elysia marginata]
MAFSKPSKLVKTITSRRSKAIDLDQFKSDVRSALQDPYSITPETFNCTLRNVLYVHAPLTARTVTKYRASNISLVLPYHQASEANKKKGRETME